MSYHLAALCTGTYRQCRIFTLKLPPFSRGMQMVSGLPRTHLSDSHKTYEQLVEQHLPEKLRKVVLDSLDRNELEVIPTVRHVTLKRPQGEETYENGKLVANVFSKHIRGECAH